MLKKAVAVLFMVAIVSWVATAGIADDSKKEDRVEGRVAYSNKDKSTFAVTATSGGSQRIVHYDASTKFSSQFHGDKNPKAIEAGEVKDGDYVICLGTYDDKGELHATAVSKRLSHSPE
jgi:hypothetical protein